MLESNIMSTRSNLNGNIEAVQSDARALVKDAQALFQAAAELTGQKADDMRTRAMEMLDLALGKAHDAQIHALAKGRELAGTADVYVKENPWRVIAGTAGFALLLGVILGRR